MPKYHRGGREVRAVFNSPDDAWRYFAMHVLARALNDVREYNPAGAFNIAVEAERAADWFVSGDHKPWCTMAGLNSRDVLRQARFNAVTTKLRRQGHEVERIEDAEKSLSHADRAWAYRDIYRE